MLIQTKQNTVDFFYNRWSQHNQIRWLLLEQIKYNQFGWFGEIKDEIARANTRVKERDAESNVLKILQYVLRHCNTSEQNKQWPRLTHVWHDKTCLTLTFVTWQPDTVNKIFEKLQRVLKYSRETYSLNQFRVHYFVLKNYEHIIKKVNTLFFTQMVSWTCIRTPTGKKQNVVFFVSYFHCTLRIYTTVRTLKWYKIRNIYQLVSKVVLIGCEVEVEEKYSIWLQIIRRELSAVIIFVSLCLLRL